MNMPNSSKADTELSEQTESSKKIPWFIPILVFLGLIIVVAIFSYLAYKFDIDVPYPD